MRTLLILLLLGHTLSAAPFHFIAHGDTGYNAKEKAAYQQLIKAINRDKPAFSIHVGDIWGSQKATDEAHRRMLKNFASYQQPLIYTPGDNEWSDTWQKARGPYDTLESLSRLRKFYFASNQSHGQKSIPLTRQKGVPENARWFHQQVLFATVHPIAPSDPRPEFKKQVQAEFNQRTQSNIQWIKQAFALAKEKKSPAMVFAWHSWLFSRSGLPGKPHSRFITAFLNEAKNYPGEILIIHGDAHAYILDKPFAAHQNITRMEVFGSPYTIAVKVSVDVTAKEMFKFSPIGPLLEARE